MCILAFTSGRVFLLLRCQEMLPGGMCKMAKKCMRFKVTWHFREEDEEPSLRWLWEKQCKTNMSVGIRSNVDTPDRGVKYGRVFVPHYESYYAQRFPTGGATKPPTTPSPTLRNRSDHARNYSGLQGLLQGPNAPAHLPWPVVSANAGSIVTQNGLQYQQMYRKLSEFQVAIRVSEQFGRGMMRSKYEGQVATEAVKEAQKQATAATQSIAMAQEATMELDKVKRETNARAVAQEGEIECLHMEVAECRMLYEVELQKNKTMNLW